MIAKFIYNNNQNCNIDFIIFMLNLSYYLYVSFKNNNNPCSRFKLAYKLINNLKKIKITCKKLQSYSKIFKINFIIKI